MAGFAFWRKKLIKPPKYFIVGTFFGGLFMKGRYLAQQGYLAKQYSIIDYMKDQVFLEKVDHRVKVLKAIQKLKLGGPYVNSKAK